MDVDIKDDVQTIDLENETDQFSYIENRDDRRWYPGCENQFLLLNRECPEKNFYEDMNKDNNALYKNITIYDFKGGIFTNSAEAVMSMNGYYLGKPYYIIDVFERDTVFFSYKIEAHSFNIHQHNSWRWQIWKADAHSMKPDQKIGQQRRYHKHCHLGYIPSEYDQWDLPDSEKWIEDIIRLYLQEFRTRMSIHELANQFDQL